jgi:hypothetical protein
MPALPFKLKLDRRHYIPRQQRKVANWPAYEAGLRQRGSVTVWFSDEAVAAWAAEPRTMRGGQPSNSPLAMLTAQILRTVFSLAYRQAEGLIGSIINLFGLTLRVPDHTLSHHAVQRFLPVEIGGRRFVPGQGKNVYIFPAMGMAVFATEAARVTEEMFIVAAHAVAEQVSDETLDRTDLPAAEPDFRCLAPCCRKNFRVHFRPGACAGPAAGQCGRAGSCPDLPAGLRGLNRHGRGPASRGGSSRDGC